MAETRLGKKRRTLLAPTYSRVTRCPLHCDVTTIEHLRSAQRQSRPIPDMNKASRLSQRDPPVRVTLCRRRAGLSAEATSAWRDGASVLQSKRGKR
jgi:hypothetical protein